VTRVSFYVLPDGDTRSRLLLACRLADKALRLGVESGQRTYVHCDGEAELAELDELMWVFSQGSFLAHERLMDLGEVAEAAPVVIGNSEPPAQLNGVLINLSAEVPPFFSRFERVAEIVDVAGKEKARSRYQFYKDRGYPLETHKLEPGQAE
jgi:DNA polymerase-3 subunit chi